MSSQCMSSCHLLQLDSQCKTNSCTLTASRKTEFNISWPVYREGPNSTRDGPHSLAKSYCVAFKRRQSLACSPRSSKLGTAGHVQWACAACSNGLRK
eukprot:1145819-Pelagomonas_calceolata.AAC.3